MQTSLSLASKNCHQLSTHQSKILSFTCSNKIIQTYALGSKRIILEMVILPLYNRKSLQWLFNPPIIGLITTPYYYRNNGRYGSFHPHHLDISPSLDPLQPSAPKSTKTNRSGHILLTNRQDFQLEICPDTLPETNGQFAPVKWMVGILSRFLLGWPIFRGYVSFREGTWDKPWKQTLKFLPFFCCLPTFFKQKTTSTLK